MTTTGTRRSPAAPAIVSLVLLAATLLAVPAPPAFAGNQVSPAGTSTTRVTVPEPATLIFAGLAGLAVFQRNQKHRLR